MAGAKGSDMRMQGFAFRFPVRAVARGEPYLGARGLAHFHDLVHAQVALRRRRLADEVRLVRLHVVRPRAMRGHAPGNEGTASLQSSVGRQQRTMATCMALRSASLYTATVRMLSRLAVRMTRQAISPRLAIRILLNSGFESTRAVAAHSPRTRGAD